MTDLWTNDPARNTGFLTTHDPAIAQDSGEDHVGSDAAVGTDVATALDRTAVESGVGADAADVNTGGGANEDEVGSEAGAGTDTATLSAALDGAAESGAGSDVASLDKPEAAADTAVSEDVGALTTVPPLAGLRAPRTGGVAVEIKVGGIDITEHIQLANARFTSAANGSPGTALFRVRDDGHGYSFLAGQDLELVIDGLAVWTGYVQQVRRGYYTTGSEKVPAARERYFEISGVDLNILFQRRVLYDKADPTNVQLTTFAADSFDSTILLAYMTDHLDLEGDRLTTALIEHVGTPSTDAEISGSAGWTWNDLMGLLTRNTGAIYYIDPDRAVVLTDVDTPNAPFGISDTPGVGQIGCRELEIDFEAGRMVNDALVWGAGQGSANPVFKRTEDATSIAAHERWQTGQVAASIWRQTTVDRISNSIVYGSPQTKRGAKDDAVAVRCVVFTPGFRVGQKVAVESEVFGYSDVLPIRQMDVEFVAYDQPRYRLVLSHAIDPAWSMFEYWIPSINLRVPHYFDGWPEWDLGWNLPTLPSYEPCLGYCWIDEFTRTVAEVTAFNDGWAGAPASLHWSGSGTNGFWSVDGDEGVLKVGETAPGDIRALLQDADDTDPPAELPFSLLVDFRLEGWSEFTDDRFDIRFVNTFGDGTVQFFPGSGAVGTPVLAEIYLGGAIPVSVNLAINDGTYHVRAEVEAGVQRVRVWSGTNEPTGWTAEDSAFDTPALFFALQAVVETSQASPFTVYVTHYELCADGGIGCSEPQEPSRTSTCEHLSREYTTSGGNQLMRASTQYEPRTARVWVDGRLIRRTLDYIERPHFAAIEVLPHVDLGGSEANDPSKPVWMCYEPRTFALVNEPTPL